VHNGAGRIAPGGSRSLASGPMRTSLSSPARPGATAPMSERTIAPEAPCIRMTGAVARCARPKRKTVKTWTEITHYAGFDWARDHHDIVIVDPQGNITTEFRIAHTLAGWQQFREKIQGYGAVAVAIETSQGAAIDQLLQSNVTVYPVHPLSAKRYRERKAPSGNKTDHLDAWALADALRVDGQGWSMLQPLDPLTQTLRLFCRDEMALIEHRTALVNQLQQALSEYYPAALEAFDDWTRPSCWEFIIHFPTPHQLVKAGKRRREQFLHVHRLWRPETVNKRLEIFARAEQFCGSEPVTAAKSFLALSLAKLLCTLEHQLQEYRKQIQALFEQHPDHDLFGSLPGAADKLAPRLLGEIGGDPDRFESVAVLQMLAGTAPVSFQSGQIHKVRIRYQCQKVLRYVVHLWANSCRKSCSWARVYYRQKRAEGKSHACALRCLGQRLLKILHAMIRTRTRYNAELHARNQQAHGSWVLKLVTKQAPLGSE